MIQPLYSPGLNSDFCWLDATLPTSDELTELAQILQIPPAQLQSYLEPEHLPRFERTGPEQYLLLIRAFDEASSKHTGTLRGMTQKIIAFIGPKQLVTIHRSPQSFWTDIQDRWRDTTVPRNRSQALLELLEAVIDSYRAPIVEAEEAMALFESSLFRKSAAAYGMLHRTYRVARRVSTAKRMLLHLLEILQKTRPAFGESDRGWNDLIETARQQFVTADELLDDLNHLLTTQLTLASYRTNEVMRLLTLFSVFFLPLTFIVGVYGMNFKHMPELDSRFGYGAVWVVMIAISLGLLSWFGRKGWLK